MSDPRKDRQLPEDAAAETLKFLEDLGALPRQAPMSQAAHDRADEMARAALGQITATAPEHHEQVRVRPRSRVRRWTRVAVAVTAPALLAAAAVVIVLSRQGNGPAVIPPSAATPPMLHFSLTSAKRPLDGVGSAGELRRLAEIAQGVKPVGSGQYQVIQTESWTLSVSSASDGAVFIPRIAKRYVAPDGSYALVQWSGKQLERDGQLVAPLSSPSLGSDQPTQQFGTITTPNPNGFSSEAPKFLSALVGTCHPQASCLGQAIERAHQEWVVTPRTEATLWNALSTVSDVKYLGATLDRLGRSAEAFSLPGRSGKSEVILVGRSDGKLLEVDTVQTTNGGVPYVAGPAVVKFDVYLTAMYSERAASPMG